MPSGCSHGEKCMYSHVKPPAQAKEKLDSKAGAKAKPKQSAPKVAAAVAIVAALSSMVTPSQAIVSLEGAADTGAGRHLVSFEALREQGYHGYHDSSFSGFANDFHENFRFSTGGGQELFTDLWILSSGGFFGDANRFLLDSCPIVRSIGLDAEQNGLGFV